MILLQNNMLNYQIELIIGDFGGDGHDKRKSIIIYSNLSSKDMQNAYNIGAEKIGVDLINEIAVEYEDTNFSDEKLKKYLKFEIIEKMKWDWNDKCDFYLDIESYIDVYLFTILIGNPNFEYKIQQLDKIDIGGYGLFY